MTGRRRPEGHLRTVNGKAVPVNAHITYGAPPADPRPRRRRGLAELSEDAAAALFAVDAPLDRDLVAATYGERWRHADLRSTQVLSGFAAAEYEMAPRHVNFLVLPGVDPAEALQSYFAAEARRHPGYAWGQPDSWSEDFAFESLILFDDDAYHHNAGVVSISRLADHGLQVIDTRQADWRSDYHEYSREKYSFSPHRDAAPLRFPDAPYRPLSHNDALAALEARGAADPAEFSVLLWLGEIELRDNDTYAVASEGYAPERNHVPPWAVDDYLSGPRRG